ncbi:uncharacterized protein LOC143180051 [Calliopsis andreniformis]|uniref:uncharacterized protein LOC143180051 n=1 Tax=Calliopsis andreniformis TaxID=337506 RepID=UPI003FCE9DD6
MEETRRSGSHRNPSDKEYNDMSVIAVIGKENDRFSMQTSKRQEDRRVIELSDERSKMILRKRLEMESLSTERDNGNDDYKDMEILQKLPPGTIVIKQDKKYKEDSDYVRDSTETSSGGSTSGSGAAKVRRVHRAARKNRGTVEIRRNPLRVTKKDPDKDFPRSRQRLLSAKRKEMLLNSEPIKRGKSSTMPYMNTRSVTRKMYNVGATYQAPTIRDETEWKEWPVHGMHERPVYHPQVGLAAEYLGRYFTSIDGVSYQEILDFPEIEVVSVDPHSDFLPCSAEKKRNKKTRTNRGSLNAKNNKISSKSVEKSASFQSCMHESFHCVLGYCSQVLTPGYKTNVEGKLSRLNESKSSSNVVKEVEKQASTTNIAAHTSKTEPSGNSKENIQKLVEGNKLSDNYTVTMTTQNMKSFNQVLKTRLFSGHKMYVANPQKSIAFTNLKALQGGQVKIQEVLQSSKNPVILVNPSEIKNAQVLKSVPNNINMVKLDDTTVNEEPLVYRTMIPNNEATENSKVMALKQTPTRRSNKVEFTVTKYMVDNKVQIGKEANVSEKKLCYETSNKELNITAVSNGLTKTWCANETSEIAKILSEYNKSSLKKPAIENQTFCASVKNAKVKEINKEENAKQSVQEISSDRNVSIKFPQGKWRRFHLTVEKLKDLKDGSEKKLPCGVRNRQSTFKTDQMTMDTTSERKTDVPKYLKRGHSPFQRGQSSTMNLERKENNSVNNNMDAGAVKTQSLQELLENTAMLYCAATGTHQEDLANYIDSLDAVQSIQWLETSKNLIV